MDNPSPFYSRYGIHFMNVIQVFDYVFTGIVVDWDGPVTLQVKVVTTVCSYVGGHPSTCPV